MSQDREVDGLLSEVDADIEDTESSISLDKIYENKIPLIFLVVGLIIVGLGVLYFSRVNSSNTSIEIIETNSNNNKSGVVVEVVGAVKSPGVYEIETGSRVDDAIKIAGGLSSDADSTWLEKTVNRAAKITDGSKLYIKSVDEQSEVLSAKDSTGDQSGSSTHSADSSKSVNINTATVSELDSLWGIGLITAQNIIEQRPYSSVEELLSRKILKSNVYERNKDMFSVY